MTRLLISLGAAAFMVCGSAFDVQADSGSSQDHASSTIIPMPEGSVPEGIAIGNSTAFVTSLSQGAVYRIDLETGISDVLKPGNGHSSVGIMLDDEHDRLFVAGGRGGSLEVIDANTGEVLASYNVAEGQETFVNDVDRLGGAVYATDSFAPVLYKLPLGDGGALPDEEDIEVIPLSGMSYVEGFNANGITQTPDERALLVVQMNTGELFRVDPADGAAETVDIGAVDLTGAMAC